MGSKAERPSFYGDVDAEYRNGRTRFSERLRHRRKVGLPDVCPLCKDFNKALAQDSGGRYCTECWHEIECQRIVDYYVETAIETHKWPSHDYRDSFINNHFAEGRKTVVALATVLLERRGAHVPRYNIHWMPKKYIAEAIVGYVEMFGELPTISGGFYWKYKDKAEAAGLPSPYTVYKHFGGVTAANRAAWDILPVAIKREIPPPKRFKEWTRDDAVDLMVHHVHRYGHLPPWTEGAGKLGPGYNLTYTQAKELLGMGIEELRAFVLAEAERRALDSETPLE